MFTYLGYGYWSYRVLWLFEILVRIHKPILALVLQKFGAEAKIDHEDCRWGDILRFCDEDFWECDIMVVYAHGSIRWDCVLYSYLPKIHVEIYCYATSFLRKATDGYSIFEPNRQMFVLWIPFSSDQR